MIFMNMDLWKELDENCSNKMPNGHSNHESFHCEMTFLMQRQKDIE